MPAGLYGYTPTDLDGNDFDDAYVGQHEDPWLHESYVIGPDPFILEIYNHSQGKKHKNIVKNVFLIVAVNNLDSFISAKSR